MSGSINKAILLGRVGSDPEIRTTAGGVMMAKFSLATSWGKGDKERTQWHRVTCWDKLAQLAETYVHKGDRIYIEGSIEYSQTDDGKGAVRYWTDIQARELVLLGENKQRAPAGAPATGASPFDDDDKELPF